MDVIWLQLIYMAIIFLLLLNSGTISASESNLKHHASWPKWCKIGKEQSPIPLSYAISVEEPFESFEFEHYDVKHPAKIKNNGYTVEIVPDPKIKPVVRGGGLNGSYTLGSLHFHWESEHTIEDQRFPLEMHAVHYNIEDLANALTRTRKGGVAVFAVLFHLSPDDYALLNPFINAVEQLQKLELNETLEIPQLDVEHFLPRDKAGFFRYSGSLTAPNCTEGVVWTVFTHTLPISSRQLQIFAELETGEHEKLKSNFRPLQRINDRKIQVKVSPGLLDAQKKINKFPIKIYPTHHIYPP